MKCAECGAELDPSERFCGECGQPVMDSAEPSTVSQAAGGTCPKCSANVDPGKRFCSSCGYDLTAAAPKPQAAASPAVSAAQPLTARTSSNSSRILLTVGVVAVAAVFLLTAAGVGLWLWLGSGSVVANQNTAPPATPTLTPANANTQQLNISIAGTWNCYFISPEGTGRGKLVLAQNGSAITGTLENLNPEDIAFGEKEQFVGTFDGQRLSSKVPNTQFEWQLALSPDGSMNGRLQFGGKTGTLLCTR